MNLLSDSWPNGSRVAVEGAFTGAQVREAIALHALAEVMHPGSYTLNRRLR